MAPTIKPEEVPEKFKIVLEGCDGKLTERPPIQTKKRQPLDIPEINLPFPPNITPREIFEKTLLRKLTKSEGARKSPNKFLIYRTVVVLELHRQNIHYSMTEVSGAIAKKWKSEPKIVKDEYTKLASQVDELNKRHFGEVSKRRARKNQIKSSSLGVNDSHHPIISNNYYSDTINNNLISKIDPIPFPCNNNYNSNLYHPYLHAPIYHTPHYLSPQQNLYQDNSYSFKQESYDTVDNYIMPIL
jgi:hypothetical protein